VQRNIALLQSLYLGCATIIAVGGKQRHSTTCRATVGCSANQARRQHCQDEAFHLISSNMLRSFVNTVAHAVCDGHVAR